MTDPAGHVQSSHQSRQVDEMDLGQLVRAIWKHRWIVVALTVAGGALGGIYSYNSTRHVADGLLLTPSLQIKVYKQYEAMLDSEPRVETFIDLHGLQGTATGESLRAIVTTPGAMAKAVRPAFAITGRETKLYDIATDQTGDLFGIYLTISRKIKRDDAPILRLADYVRDTIIEFDMRTAMLEQCLVFRSREQELRNEKLQSEFSVRQARVRAGQLRELIATIPGASSFENRQIISVDNGAERFLPPVAQLVAVELEVGDAELAAVVRERERVTAGLKRDYYCGAMEIHQKLLGGRIFFEELEKLQKTVFAAADMSKDAIEISANALELQRRSWFSHYFERTRFVVSPDGGERKIRNPSLALGGVLGGMVGGLFGLLTSLALAWWRENRDVVLEQEHAQ